MLDVHAPEHTPHTWRDFFIHIATIVVGLLIALGLEQMAEYVHHRHELRETREALAKEREHNREHLKADADYLPNKSGQLQNDILVLQYLQQHPGTPEENLPGVLRFNNFGAFIETNAWETAKQTGVTQLMNQQEAVENSTLYELLSTVREEESHLWEATAKAAAFGLIDPDPSHLTPAQVQQELELTKNVMEAEFRLAVVLNNLGQALPDFKGMPTNKDLSAMETNPVEEAKKPKLEAAMALTRARINAATGGK